jgi:hypothetical protein
MNAARTAWALPDSPWTDPRSAPVRLAAGPQEANNGINLGAGARPLGRAPSGGLLKGGEHHFWGADSPARRLLAVMSILRGVRPLPEREAGPLLVELEPSVTSRLVR